MKKFYVFLLCTIIICTLIIGFFKFIKGTDMPDLREITHTEEYTEKIIDVPKICQFPDLPTGCESVAATMVLQYYGEDISAPEFVISCLNYDDNFYSANGKTYGPNPNKVFAGNPFTTNSYGCFADVIVDAVNRKDSKCKAQKITDKSLSVICSEYIDNNEPIVVWATNGMKESKKGNIWYLDDGSPFSWIAGEHCLVLVGYNKNFYFFNDPMSGGVVAYEKEISERRFEELGRQAVLIGDDKKITVRMDT